MNVQLSMKKTVFILFTLYSIKLNAQNLFPVKVSNCKVRKFCLDCGDVKASYQETSFLKLQQRLNKSLDLTSVSGEVRFQLLVDSLGKGCVLSHSDISNSKITRKIIKELNKFDKWTPAVTKNIIEEKSSINLLFILRDGKITGRVERVDKDAFKKGFDRPSKPEIFNKEYAYKNENLENYKITVWNKTNSNLPDNMNDHISIDNNGLIWLTTGEGLVIFNGIDFQNAEQNITDKGKYFAYYALATDNDNTKWVFATGNVYSFDDKTWKKYEEREIGIKSGYEIVNNINTNEIFFCADKGLTIYKQGKWTVINQDMVKELPSNRVLFAKRDSKSRIWIGTVCGTVMIDEHNKATNFENTKTFLKGKCITSMDEDENGNLYFSLYEFNRRDEKKVNNNEGILVRYTDGMFRQFTTDNSGMPFNHAKCVLYDQKEKILWISTDRAGLVRFDLKDGWENYHNGNSEIPTAYISEMKFDKQGNLYLATRQGLVRIERK